MRRLLGIITLFATTMACAPTTGMLHVDAPLAPATTTPVVPTVSVTSRPEATPPARPTPSTPTPTPETPEETVSLEPSPPAPSEPPVTVAAVDESTWIARFRADFAAQAVTTLADIDLNREASGPVTKAYGFNVPDTHDPEGFLWNDGDRGVDAWYPQGIGGFERDGRRWLVVSWYAKDAKEEPTTAAEALSYRGARLSLVDITDPKHITYRHLLLVQDAANIKAKGLFRLGALAKTAYTQGDRYAPVPVHAGGLEVYDHWIYVVDTQLGVRVFDLNQLFRAGADEAKNTCGVVDGKLVAFDYRLIVPQVAHYKITGAAPYSCLSLDRSSMTLWVGQYLAESDAARSAVTGIPLGTDGRLADRATHMSFPKDTGTFAHRIQGVFRRGDQTWMSITGQSRYEGSTARLALYEDGAATGFRWRWPHGAEDLYYDETQDRLWSLTEFPDSWLAGRDRCVFGVRLGSYRAP